MTPSAGCWLALLAALGAFAAGRAGAQETAGQELPVTAPPESAAGAPAADPATSEYARALVARWGRQLESLETAARGGAWEEDSAVASALTGEMIELVATGHRQMLARALRLSALANHASGDPPRLRRIPLGDVWQLELARHLDPAAVAELPSFGPVGVRLAERLHQEDQEVNSMRAAARRHAVDPDLIAAHIQGFHRLLPSGPVQAAGLSASVPVHFVVDTDGRVRGIELSGPPVETGILLNVMDFLRGLRFEPAMLDGDLVPAEIRYRLVLGATS